MAVVVTILVYALVEDGPDERVIFGGAWLLLMSAALVGRIWLAWLSLTVVTAGDLVITIVNVVWLGILFNAVMLVLLVAPPTRRYTQRWRPRIPRRFRRQRNAAEPSA